MELHNKLLFARRKWRFSWVILAMVISILLPVGSPLQAQTGDGPQQAQLATGPYLPLVLKPPPMCNGDFESGHVCWTETSSLYSALITDVLASAPATPHSGAWVAWLGGDNNEHSILQQYVTVPANTPYLGYWHWIYSGETACGVNYGVVIDLAQVQVNGIRVDGYDLCEANNTSGWVHRVVDLSPYVGQFVSLQFLVDNDGILISHLFIDDVAFQANANPIPGERVELIQGPVLPR